jgi:hypothetical protein
MSLKRFKSVAGFFFIPLFTLFSQNIHVAGLFPTIDHSGNVSNRLGYSLYYFAAFPVISLDQSKQDTYFNLFYSEQALTYKLNGRFSITGSYVYQRANAVYDNYVNENRFYIQTKYKHVVNKITFTHRLRFDGRFIQNRETNETPFTHRIRYLIGMETPVNEKFYFTAYEEAFFNTFKNPGALYAENWAYMAVGKQLSSVNKIELGVLYLTWNIGGKSWFNQYYLQATWISHIDFRKTK